MERQRNVQYGKAAAALALSSAILVFAGLTGGFTSASAVGTPVDLGTAEPYAVLAGETVTNTGVSVLTGDLGVSPGSAITGFPPGIVNGTQHANDAVAIQAKSDLVAAYNDAAGQASDVTLSSDLGGLTLVPGVYTESEAQGLTGDLTLDAQGDSSAVFVFQIGSTLTAAPGSKVLLINGANACNVFWQVGSSATIDTTSTFVGTIMALASITVNTGATIDGRALARNGAVTLQTNTITRPECADAEDDDDDGTDVDTDGTDVDTDGTDVDTDADGTDADTDGTDADTDGTDVDTDADGTDADSEDSDSEDSDSDSEDSDSEDSDSEDSDSDSEDSDADSEDSDADEGSNSNDDDDDDEGSTHRDVVPQGHPETGLGGSAPERGPVSVLLLGMGGLAAAGAVVVAVPVRRRAIRKHTRQGE